MKSIKFSIFGSDGYTCQIPRIKQGMELLGHKLSDDCPDLIYSNDPKGYEDALKLKEKYQNAYLILNFLDVPWHIKNIEKFTKILVDKYFPSANAITAISYKVKKDLSKLILNP